MLFLNESEVRKLLPMREAIRLMAETFASLREGAAMNQPRRRMHVEPFGSVLHAMAGTHGKYFGTKVYATNARHGNANFLFWLLDAATAKPLALMEANWLGQIRTGAASGYATDVLARADAKTHGVIGSGFQAQGQVEAVACVRAIEEVRVWSRNAANRERFAREQSEALGCKVVATATAEEAVRGMDIVSTATWAKDPVLEASWVGPGAHVNAMGSNNAARRELPAELVHAAALVAVDSVEQARIESGDLLLAGLPPERWVELKDAVRVDAGITIFKSNGLGVEDVAAGAFVFEQAIAKGVGKEI